MRAGRRPSPEGTRLLFAGTISPTICLGDGPTEGRHDKTRRKARKRKEKKNEETKRKEKKRREQRHRARKTKQAFLCPAGGARTTQMTRGKAEIEGKNDNNNHKRLREKQTSLKTKQTRTQGDAADAEMQSTRAPTTWQGTGPHSKEQRLGLRMYGSHLSPPDNAP